MAATVREDDLAYVRAGGLGEDLDTMLVYNLLRTHSYLAPFMDAHLRGSRLTAAQLNAMLVLRPAGDQGLPMGEIGRRLVVTKSNVTGLVDRLEAQRLVTRTSGRGDRRSIRVRLTAAGAGLLDEVVPGHAELLAELGV